MTPVIDYGILAAAQAFYAAAGFQELVVPWAVSAGPYDATRPPGSRAVEVQNYGTDRFLVASGEQSLLQLYRDGYVDPATLRCLSCVTPCHRIEEFPDDLRLPHFMKLELMTVVPDSNDASTIRDGIAVLAMQFLSRYVTVRAEQFDDGSVDIVTNRSGVELGSYGVRRWEGLLWVYGTGVALPRLQQAIVKEASCR